MDITVNTNTYLIHLKHDVGRYHHIKEFLTKLNCIIWDGILAIPLDDNHYRLHTIPVEKGTQAAKTAKINMFKHFLSNSNDNHIIVFEDDILWHKQFIEHHNSIITNLYKFPKWKIIYYGVSTELNEDIKGKNKTIINKHLSMNNFPTTKIHTGAYAFILNRDVIPEVLERAESKDLIGKPFDVTCLGYLQQKYQDECFIVDPQLILADVASSNIRHIRNTEIFGKLMNWNYENYIIPSKLPLIVIADNNVDRLSRFINIANTLMPVIHIHILLLVVPDSDIFPYLLQCKQQGILYTVLTIRSKFDDAIKQHLIANDILKNSSMFFITNIYIFWKNELPIDFFSNTSKILQTYDCITYNIEHCRRCNMNKKLVPTNLYQTFTVFNTKNYIDKNNYNIMFATKLFYSSLTCFELSQNNLHNTTLQDIINQLSYYSNKIPTFHIICDTINYLGECKWTILFDKWLVYYYLNTLNKECDLELVDNVFTYEISRTLAKKFSTKNFNKLKFITEHLHNGIIFKLNKYLIRNWMGNSIVEIIELLHHKYNILMVNIDFTVYYN